MRTLAVVVVMLASLIAPLGCRCGEDLRALQADIAVSPAAIDFSRSRVDFVSRATVTIANHGGGRLTLDAYIEPEGSGFTLEGVPDFVEPGLSAAAVVLFSPPARVAFAAELVLLSNDDDTPELRVPLHGEGGPPILAIDPDPIDLGRVNEGPGQSQVVHLTNIGFDVLALTSATLQRGDAFTLAAATVPAALSPGDTLAVNVSLAPSAAMAALVDDAGLLVDRLVVTHVDGEGGAPISARINLAPIAVAVEERTRKDVVKVSVGRVLVIDGSDTTDPDGDPFTFTWALSARPDGSDTAIIGQGEPTTLITPDVAGSYLVSLRATDAHGAFADAAVTILPRDLSITLTWDAAPDAPCHALADGCGNSDLDLHLLRPSGVLGDYGICPVGCSDADCSELGEEHPTCRSFGTDCAYANRAPEWAEPGRADDPRLDVDDVRGFGPEVTSVDGPEDGVWHVVAHYCSDRGLLDGGGAEPTLATVTVFEEGVPSFVTAPQRVVQGDAWTALVLERSNGAWNITAPSGVLEAAPPGSANNRGAPPERRGASSQAFSSSTAG